MNRPVDGAFERRIRRFLTKARKAVRLKSEVGLRLTSNREMRKLNRDFRGKDKATDVLSFPAAEAVSANFAGDLAISLDIAAVNARKLGHSVEEEVRVLILHGLLHLAGYDHETDEGQMARKELRLREELRLPMGLIERAPAPMIASTMARKRKPRSSSPLRRAR
jgi:probable rRNA maturation factor